MEMDYTPSAGFKYNNATWHDFLNNNKWLKLFSVHLMTTKGSFWLLLNRLYFCLVVVLFGCFFLMCLGAILSTLDDKETFLQAVHVFALVIVSTIGLLNRFLNDRDLKETVDILRRGVFRYPKDEGADEVSKKLLVDRITSIQFISKWFTRVVLSGGFANVFFIASVKYLLSSDRDVTSARTLDPLLPQPVYIPFQTRTNIGYSLGLAVNCVLLSYICAIVASMDEIYVSFMIQLKAQLELLRISLGRIEERAMSRCGEKMSRSRDLYSSSGFQDSMCLCLRNNIRHHQQILRMKNTMQNYVRVIILLLVCLASLVLAAISLLVLESTDTFIVGVFGFSMVVEMSFTFQFCWYAEQVMHESSEVFQAVYSTPWWRCNKKFRLHVSFMLANCREPMSTRAAWVSSIIASLNTFGSIISRMYQLMNVIRQAT
uniref:Odorant receptor n=1 Tax=Yemma signatus TaxID=300820 RepID=A0A385H5W3_9HEMI|nr:odorant receptor [Yemma signatus]